MPEQLVDRAAVIAAVEAAAALAMTSWRDGAAPDTRVWSKSNDSPVSDIDMEVDALLKERLTGYPARGRVAVGRNCGRRSASRFAFTVACRPN